MLGKEGDLTVVGEAVTERLAEPRGITCPVAAMLERPVKPTKEVAVVAEVENDLDIEARKGPGEVAQIGTPAFRIVGAEQPIQPQAAG